MGIRRNSADAPGLTAASSGRFRASALISAALMFTPSATTSPVLRRRYPYLLRRSTFQATEPAGPLSLPAANSCASRFARSAASADRFAASADALSYLAERDETTADTPDTASAVTAIQSPASTATSVPRPAQYPAAR